MDGVTQCYISKSVTFSPIKKKKKEKFKQFKLILMVNIGIRTRQTGTAGITVTGMINNTPVDLLFLCIYFEQIH